MANEILKFATNVTVSNVLTQAEYAATNPSPRTVGHVPGIASNKLENKALMQVSTIASGIGTWLDIMQSTIPDITDQLTNTEIATAMEQAALASVPAATTTVVGKSRFATNAEITTGTLSTASMTPAGLYSVTPSTTQRALIRTASASDMTTGTATDAAVTPNVLGVLASSMTSNGYARLPGGLVVQWGTAAVTSGTNTTVTLPFTFPNACLCAVTCGIATGTTIGVVSFTTTTVVLNSGNTTSARWIAVGN
jgi:hypothetical protein